MPHHRRHTAAAAATARAAVVIYHSDGDASPAVPRRWRPWRCLFPRSRRCPASSSRAASTYLIAGKRLQTRRPGRLLPKASSPPSGRTALHHHTRISGSYWQAVSGGRANLHRVHVTSFLAQRPALYTVLKMAGIPCLRHRTDQQDEAGYSVHGPGGGGGAVGLDAAVLDLVGEDAASIAATKGTYHWCPLLLLPVHGSDEPLHAMAWGSGRGCALPLPHQSTVHLTCVRRPKVCLQGQAQPEVRAAAAWGGFACWQARARREWGPGAILHSMPSSNSTAQL